MTAFYHVFVIPSTDDISIVLDSYKRVTVL
jgi:hypothetical protein